MVLGDMVPGVNPAGIISTRRGNILFVSIDCPSRSTGSTCCGRPRGARASSGGSLRRVTILIVEDEEGLNRIISDYLVSIGWQTISVQNGPDALELFYERNVDFVLLDIMIPGLDGLDVIRRIRAKSHTPVIFITAMAEESDKLIGLELGADDYITKPFSLKELAARIRSVMRRVDTEEHKQNSLKILNLELDTRCRRASFSGRALDLTTVQFDILYGFMRQPGRVFSRAEIMDFFQVHAWEAYERTIDVHIKNIRKSIVAVGGQPGFIQTVRGIGYRLEIPR